MIVFDRSSFSTIAATSGDGHASESSRAGGGAAFLAMRRTGALTVLSASQVNSEIPSDLATPLALGVGFWAAIGFGTARSTFNGTGGVSCESFHLLRSISS
jgi:hypothetical protein